MGWVGGGSINPVTGKRLGDGGCQCGRSGDYCGFLTRDACTKRPQCRWNAAGCVNKFNPNLGVGGLRVCPPNSPAPSKAPTLCVDLCDRNNPQACPQGFGCGLNLKGCYECQT